MMRWKIIAAIGLALLTGVILGAVGPYFLMARGGADLKPWHRLTPELEFTADDVDDVDNLEAYMALEDRLFEEIAAALDNDVDTWPMLSRLDPGSPTNPATFPRNWNRTYLLEPEHTVAGALLLHGLSDSPYSLRAVAEHLHERGVVCVGLRLPGHGGVPGGLTASRNEDWRAAVRMGVRAVGERVGPNGPLILVGYSNGAALALEYTLEALEDGTLPRPDRLVFFSPAFAVTKIAAFARWQRMVSSLPGLEKLAWTGILPEYDPFKFNSFPLRAAEEIYRLTTDVERKLQRLENQELLVRLPPVISFQSVVDATVPAEASLSRLYSRVGANGSRLVLFDVDREARSEAFLNPVAGRILNPADRDQAWPFDIVIVTNRNPDSALIELRTVRAGTVFGNHRVDGVGLEWPRGVYSLSHVALPFPPDDPVYGIGEPWRRPFPFGHLDLKGEQGALVVPPSLLMRLRYNPFFDVIPPMIDEFLSLDRSDASATAES